MNRRFVALIALAALVIVGAWYLLLYRPAGDELAEVETRVATAEATRDQLQISKANIESLKEQRPRLQSEIEQLRAAVPDRSGVADILLLVDEAARDAGLTFVNYTSSDPVGEDEFGLSGIAIQINGDGGYFQVLDFINRLGRFERVLVIDSVALSGNQDDDDLGPPNIEVSLGVTAFVSGQPAEDEVQTTSTGGDAADEGSE